MRIIPVASVCAGLLFAAAASQAASATTDADGDGDAYCAAHLAAETAFSAEDPEAIGAAVDDLFATAPDELAETIATMIETAPEFGPPTPEFITAYSAVAAWVKDNCGFADLEVLAVEYSFGGLPEEVASGPTVITLVNEGDEWHEIVLLKRGEGVDMPVEELLEVPDEELDELITFLGAAYAAPDEQGYMVADLEPGEYIALCFFPVGSTPEVFEEMMAAFADEPGPGASDEHDEHDETGDTDGDDEMGPPHFVHGMVQEFTVTD